jgi:hypothetical protein
MLEVPMLRMMGRTSGLMRLTVAAAAATLLLPTASAHAATTAATAPAVTGGTPVFSNAVAFDTSRPLAELAQSPVPPGEAETGDSNEPEDGPIVPDTGHSADGALQTGTGAGIAGPTTSFEGISNQDNFNSLGFRVNPPDPDGAAGPNDYVEMANLQVAVYTKAGAQRLGPTPIGALWAGFAVNECTDESGDPVVMYDQVADRWILTQFTTRGINFPNEPLDQFYNCVAVSTTPDPTGPYFRYAFSTGFNFPDYPKYGIFKDSYIITTREFGILDPSFYGIGVYGLDRNKLLVGDPGARAVKMVLDSSVVPINLMGDGLLPAMVDGKTKPKNDAKIPIVGTQDDGGPYGATFDALNIWDFDVKWRSTPTASLVLNTQLPVASFDSVFPCAATSARDCLPQPGITDPTRFLDVLSYRQRPTWRLAYRNNGTYETMVTAQSVEATPGIAGMRWYEIRRVGSTYSLAQQGTYAPADGVDRWMGSVAMDKRGNTALAYSVVNGVDVFPGIRYTGRLAGDPPGVMTLGEATVINGTGVQTTTNSRWGDYTSMNLDPTDDCTFWYVNEYYTAAGQASSTAGWQTRIASFRLPGC